jgi:hypothetical protein
MVAASKRIANSSSGGGSSGVGSGGSGGSTGTPEDVRRNFVLSASGYRRSRGKTVPTISPIEDVEKFIRENQEEDPSDSSNVRRTASYFQSLHSLLFTN